MNNSWNAKIFSYWQKTWFFPEHLEKWFILKSINEVARESKGILLDVGCGTKPYYDIFKENVCSYIGIEYPFSSNPEIKKKADIFANGIELPIKSNSIDIVLSTQVLEHLPHPEKFFEEVYRVLKKGGKLFLTTNQEWGIHKAPYDYFRFTRYGLKYLCESSGLDCLEVENRGGFWVMIGQRLSAYLYDRWVNRFREKFKTIFLINFIITAPFIALIQLASILVDKVDYIETNTIGYFLKAKKPCVNNKN